MQQSCSSPLHFQISVKNLCVCLSVCGGGLTGKPSWSMTDMSESPAPFDFRRRGFLQDLHIAPKLDSPSLRRPRSRCRLFRIGRLRRLWFRIVCGGGWVVRVIQQPPHALPSARMDAGVVAMGMELLQWTSASFGAYFWRLGSGFRDSSKRKDGGDADIDDDTPMSMV
jgi:hypothetical protein